VLGDTGSNRVGIHRKKRVHGRGGQLSQAEGPVDRRRVPAKQIRIESVGVNPLDLRRVDVAVDLTLTLEPVDVEFVIVGPGDDELCSILLLKSRESELDKVMHLREDAEPGEHTLHVGVFVDNELVTRAARRFTMAQPK
jgi:hypothetical protein